MFEERLPCPALPLHRKGLQAQIEAHPGALAEALQSALAQCDVEEEQRIEHAGALLVRRIDGVRFAESISTFPGPLTVCAPAGPAGKQATSPARSVRSPSGVRRVGVPSTTSSHSSTPWW